MTMLDDMRARGLRVTVTKAGKLRVTPASRLTPADRTALRVQSKALLALLALDNILADEAARNEQDQRATVEAAEARAQREALMRKADVMATWDEGKVRALAAAGRLTPEDVQLWHVVREELLRRVWLQAIEGIPSDRLGCVVRIAG
jgi:hypothetical protein